MGPSSSSPTAELEATLGVCILEAKPWVGGT